MAEFEFTEAARELKTLESNKTRLSIVASPFDGRVMEVTAARGALVAAEGQLVSIDRAGTGTLDVAMYVAGSEGKRIKPGAEVRLFPSTTKREEHGYLIGSVRYVSDYPATPESLLQSLGSEDLVHEVANVPAPFELRISLARNDGNYLWSRNATPPALSAGTLCSGQVIVRRERPIGFVIPALKRENRA